MENPILRQLTEAAASMAAGAAAGFIYDVIRVIRRRVRSAVFTMAADAFFWLITALGLFMLGIGCGSGEQRLFMTVMAVPGAVLYFVLLSPWAVKLLDFFSGGAAYMAHIALYPAKKMAAILIKSFFLVKKLFSSLKKRYKMNNKKQSSVRQYAPDVPGGTIVETETHTYSY